MNDIYDIARRDLLNAQINWPVADLVVSAWSGTPNFVAADQMISDIKGRGNVEIGSSMPIESTSVSMNGTAQTDHVIIQEVPIGPSVTWLTMARKEAAHDSSRLVIFVDQAEGLPFTPNGLDMLITPDWLQNRGWWRP